MNKYQKLGVGIISGIILVVIVTYYISYKIDTKTPETDHSSEEILEENKGDLSTEVNEYSNMESDDVYEVIHKMANTLIVAEDGLIYGEIEINDESINRAMNIVNDTTTIEKEERLVFMNILQDWKEEDFSNGVQAHNYAWARLNGSIGRAKDLREKYK